MLKSLVTMTASRSLTGRSKENVGIEPGHGEFVWTSPCGWKLDVFFLFGYMFMAGFHSIFQGWKQPNAERFAPGFVELLCDMMGFMLERGNRLHLQLVSCW